MRSKSFLFALPLAAALAFSCTKETAKPEVGTEPSSAVGESGQVIVPFTAEAGATETKVEMSGGSTANIVFSAGDKLMVFLNGYVQPSILTLKSGAGQRSATFSGNLTLAEGKTEADLAGKRLFASLIPEAGVSAGIFTYDPSTKRLTVDYSKGVIDSDLEALVSRTIMYDGETTYEARKFSFRMLNSYVKMNVTVPSEESDLARDYTVSATYDYHIRSKASNWGLGWGGENEAATVSGTFRASNSTSGTAYLAILADKSMRIEDDDVIYDEVKIQIGMENDYKEYGLTGGIIDKQVIVPGKGYTKAVTLKDPDNEDVLLGQPESVRNRVFTGSNDKDGNGYLSKYEAAQITNDISFNSLTELTNASFLYYFTGLTSLSGNNFYNCSNMTRVNLPKHLTSIGVETFSGCTSLNTFSIPSGVTSIGQRAFEGCSSINGIQIPSSVTEIGSQAFIACSALTDVYFESPCSLTSIASGTFQNCTSLDGIDLPSSIKTLEDSAFEGCTALMSVSLANINTIGEYVFRGCSSLDNVSTSPGTTVGKGAFRNCTSLKSIVLSPLLSAQASSIEPYTFAGCTSLEHIEIHYWFTSIGASAFEGCTSLTDIEYKGGPTSSNLETIGNSAFRDCSSLVTVEIPHKVTSIGNHAFSYCENLKTVYSYPTTPPSITNHASDVFVGHASGFIIYVPEESLVAYRLNSAGWNYYHQQNCIQKMP
ncbi:MAG: leucine-rich repeat domain-containing protein [Bacteroidales bacterium]|nr:leucine-rich repeat domain-containing protein [Bacteroidales bacterium]